MVDSIAKTLGAGSGIDIKALVSSLVEAQFDPKNKAFTKREETLTAQVSAVSQLKSGITSFATSLSTLVKGGTLSTQATSSNTNIVKASVLPGANVTTLNATVEVRALAASQVAATTTPLAAGANTGTGSLTLRLGSIDGNGDFQWNNTVIPDITIGAGDATLTGVAAKINAANAGVTASVITDAGGERLVIKGESGAAKAFTLTATETPGAEGLAALNVGAGATGTSIVSTAADARVAIDGVEVRRATNSISDLVPGIRLDLQAEAVGTRVVLGSTPATAALTQAVNDVVAAYNELYGMLKTATDPATGPLARDTAALDMMRKLRSMTLIDLTGASGNTTPKTLAEIGVATNRDGTLRVDSALLTRSLTNHPGAVEKMFSDGAGATGSGLSGALNSMQLSVTSMTYGLGASGMRYAKAQSVLATNRSDATVAQEKLSARLTQQFASMDSKVAAYKSTQTFLTNQIAAWNAS